jgi:hypothetical protein
MIWTRNRKVAAALGIASLVLVLGGLGWYFFAPKPTQQLAQAAPGGNAVKTGRFQSGDPLHEASGSVSVLLLKERYVLRFENFSATSGPGVYVYLTPQPRASTAAQVEGDGVKVRTPTAMGQATLRGDFNLDIPEGVDVARYSGVAIWCDTYNVLFGFAELSSA